MIRKNPKSEISVVIHVEIILTKSRFSAHIRLDGDGFDS
jgi:hypothetical protein